jgi:CTP:molybdopterin cytidylyltransferase MocA
MESMRAKGAGPVSRPENDEASSAAPLPTVAGIVLAAGAGSRYGGPKALAHDTDGQPWLVRTARVLHGAGCAPVIVVLGAEGDAAEALLGETPSGVALPDGADVPTTIVVHARDWAEGLSASLRAGLNAASALGAQPGWPVRAGRPGPGTSSSDGSEPSDGSGSWTAAPPVAVLVVPVDVPDLDVATVSRVLGESVGGAAVTASSLRQAVFGGRPGHPVVIGRSHWAALRASLAGDTGARPYLLDHGVLPIECGDLATGLDVDTRPVAS